MSEELVNCPKCGATLIKLPSSYEEGKFYYRCSSSDCKFIIGEEYTDAELNLQGTKLKAKCISCGEPLTIAYGPCDTHLYARCFNCSVDLCQASKWINSRSNEAKREIEQMIKEFNAKQEEDNNLSMEEELEVSNKENKNSEKIVKVVFDIAKNNYIPMLHKRFFRREQMRLNKNSINNRTWTENWNRRVCEIIKYFFNTENKIATVDKISHVIAPSKSASYAYPFCLFLEKCRILTAIKKEGDYNLYYIADDLYKTVKEMLVESKKSLEEQEESITNINKEQTGSLDLNKKLLNFKQRIKKLKDGCVKFLIHCIHDKEFEDWKNLALLTLTNNSLIEASRASAIINEIENFLINPDKDIKAKGIETTVTFSVMEELGIINEVISTDNNKWYRLVWYPKNRVPLENKKPKEISIESNKKIKHLIENIEEPLQEDEKGTEEPFPIVNQIKEPTEEDIKQRTKSMLQEYEEIRKTKLQEQPPSPVTPKITIATNERVNKLRETNKNRKPNLFFKMLKRKLYLKPRAYIRKFLYKPKEEPMVEIIKF